MVYTLAPFLMGNAYLFTDVLIKAYGLFHQKVEIAENKCNVMFECWVFLRFLLRAGH